MTREEQMLALLAEAHTMLDRHANERTAYYTAPFLDHDLLNIQQASIKAIDCILYASALASRHHGSPIVELLAIMRKETDQRVVKHLENVLAKFDDAAINAAA